MEIACGEPSEELWGDLLFAVARLQARRLERNRDREGAATIGIGGGQTSRVDAVSSRSTRRASTATTSRRRARSDAFFPFPTARRRARRRRDGDHPAGRLEARRRGDRGVRAAGATMVLTGRRHFRH
jgi:AICAR transformylase/IMP cyclohydrolase PurH